MENLRKENAKLREQYQKLQYDHQTHLASAAAMHHNQGETDGADRTWRKET